MLYSFFIIASQIAIIFVSNLAYAANCSLQIRTNDPQAVVYVDDKLRGIGEIKLSCLNRKQKLKIISSRNQVYKRVIPIKSSLNLGDRNMNIYFSEDDERTIVSRGAYKGTIIDDVYLAGELSRLKSIINIHESKIKTLMNLLNGHGKSVLPGSADSGGSKAEVSSTIVQRGQVLNNFVRQPSAIGSSFLNGYYLQLYSLSSAKYKVNEIKKLVLMSGFQAKELPLKFCNWQSNDNIGKSKKWTQVILGPFANRDDAFKARQIIGHGSFVINKQQCHKVSEDIYVKN